MLLGRRVKIKGWLFFDVDHKEALEHINPAERENWRTIVWELHP